MTNPTQLTEKLYGIVVPVEAGYIEYSKCTVIIDDKINVVYMEDFKFKILGTVTADNIDFKTETLVESWHISGIGTVYKAYKSEAEFKSSSDTSFSNLLTSKGIAPTKETKILIIEKL